MRVTFPLNPDRIADLVRPTFVALLLFTAAVLTLGRAQAEIVLTDVAGRTVTLEAPAHRLLIDDGRFLTALSLLHRDPVAVLAAWPRDINRFGERTYADYAARFPAIDRLAKVASSAGKLSVEQVLAARPDVAVFSLGSQPSDADRATMEAAGIKVMVIDFFIHPLTNTEPSLLLLGRATGAQEAAERFLAYRREKLEAIRARIAASPKPAPTVFLEPHAAQTDDCCNSPGKGNVGDLIAFAGGDNIGAAVIPRAFGKLNLEYVIAQDPEVYIATGGAHMAGTAGLTVGPEFPPDVARHTLQGVVARPGFAALKAVREGRVHGLSHQLLNSPLDIVTAQILAAWIRPDLFSEAEADEVQRTLNERFLAVPVAGPNWIDLD
ncbi:ABC transporter substrate-binding protein [Ancylobacter sp. 6x-1]|uniref:ABC transporter substrate-binding protein n=1 Tax=Ancylobacter crimeensis TaxID=2579147 RepID=A0ABT0DB94_9HYPH|nr:ABC transporter substrate-binding protein [Ancylobacter crimeensis]MCK0197226.1 ABC transporter substrate-binding protein [Ancylobacter crimeensis]